MSRGARTALTPQPPLPESEEGQTSSPPPILGEGTGVRAGKHPCYADSFSNTAWR
jgi:hypothetical protein